MTQNCDSTYVEIAQQILSVARTLYPPTHCDLNWISMAKVVGDVFCKRPHIKCHLLMSLVEPIMSDWTSSLSHVYIVCHCYVVQLLIPAQRRQVHFRLPELVSEIKRPYSPLLRSTLACA